MNDTKERIVLPSSASGAIRYQHILEAITAAILSGSLAPGERLPPQRELAKHFGIAVGTVSRAYTEAARQNLITASVGRGSFVSPADRQHLIAEDQHTNGLVDFSVSRPSPVGAERAFAETLRQLGQRSSLSELLSNQPANGSLRFREGAAIFVAGTGLEAAADEIVICNGVQHGLAAVLMAFAKPGETILTESLNYRGIHLLAHLYRLNLVAVEMDADGLRPDALEAACKLERPRFLFISPTIHNPTTRSIPDARRRAIAKIARRHDLILIEDDIYGRLPDEPRLPISSLIRERSFYLTGMSKCVTTGLRVGYIVAPEHSLRELIAAIQATAWMASAVMAEVATRWMHDGTADAVISWNREEAKRRHIIAKRILSSAKMEGDDVAYALWLHLPEPWRQEEFAAEARTRGVLVAPGESFVIDRRPAPHAVRLSFGEIIDDAVLTQGLTTLARLLAERPTPIAGGP